MGLNFTLTTTAGEIDLLGEVTGGGTFEELRLHSERSGCSEIRIGASTCLR